MNIKPVPGIPQTQVIAAVRQIFRNEIMPDVGDDGRKGLIELVRSELGEAVRTMFRHHGGPTRQQDFLENLIRREVSMQLTLWNKDPKKLEKLVEAAINAEVARQVRERLKVNVDGNVSVAIDPDHYRDRAEF